MKSSVSKLPPSLYQPKILVKQTIYNIGPKPQKLVTVLAPCPTKLFSYIKCFPYAREMLHHSFCSTQQRYLLDQPKQNKLSKKQERKLTTKITGNDNIEKSSLLCGYDRDFHDDHGFATICCSFQNASAVKYFHNKA